MFSSGNSTNPFLQLSPSSHLSPPPFFSHDGHDIFLHHHHHPDLLVSDLFSANFPVIDTISTMEVSNKATTNQETSTGLNEQHCSPPQNVVVRRKRVGKNDRHSKIRTARGLRDRRVRLSIEIASKFFGLQDTLGFDKASKTLDWLLTNSKTAIKELKLTHIKHSSCNGGDNEAAGDNGGSSGIVSKSKPLMSVTKEKKVQQQQHRAAFNLLARESRARARARARERTREKRRLNDPKEHPDSIPPTSLTQIEAGDRMDSPHNQMVGGTEINTEDSVVIKRKLKPSSIFNDQQNLSNIISSL